MDHSTDQVIHIDKYIQAGSLFIFGLTQAKKQPTLPGIEGTSREIATSQADFPQ